MQKGRVWSYFGGHLNSLDAVERQNQVTLWKRNQGRWDGAVRLAGLRCLSVSSVDVCVSLHEACSVVVQVKVEREGSRIGL